MDFQAFVIIVGFVMFVCYSVFTVTSFVDGNFVTDNLKLDEVTLRKMSDELNKKAMMEWDEAFYAKYPQMKPKPIPSKPWVPLSPYASSHSSCSFTPVHNDNYAIPIARHAYDPLWHKVAKEAQEYESNIHRVVPIAWCTSSEPYESDTP